MESGSASTHPNLINPFELERLLHVDDPFANPTVPVGMEHSSFSWRLVDGQYWKDPDLNDGIIQYIYDILMADDTEDLTIEQSAFQATRKSFYEALDPPPNDPNASLVNEPLGSAGGRKIERYHRTNNKEPCEASETRDPRWDWHFSKHKPHCGQTLSFELTPQPRSSESVFGSTTGKRNIVEDGCGDSTNDGQKFPYTSGENESTLGDLTSTGLLPHQDPKGQDDVGRCMTRQPAPRTEPRIRSESDMFDLILLSSGEQCESELRRAFESMNLQRPSGKRERRKKRNFDLRAHLILCAEAIAAHQKRSATELLAQIRQHSSPTGDGMQRFASYFADGLEARLAGTGTQRYTAIFNHPSSTATLGLKCQHLFASVCPFIKLSYFFSNKTIMHVADKATKLHIIDFGINYGFQWPSFIEQLSSTPGGPPLLWITAIESPKPGARPTEWIEETGRRLANYAERFNVSFKFDIITKRWDTIRVSDIRTESDEVLVVNCMYQFRFLFDETVAVESPSPRDMVLKLIKDMNPKVFIQGVWNAAFTTPYFLTRFREAMYNYSSMFDILDSTVPWEIPDRMIFEQTVLGNGSRNVIACEGFNRNERSETYRQWQSRNQRVGFRRLPLNEELVKTAKKWVASAYHKDFLIEEDNGWLVQGWKGRVLNSIAAWKPVK